MTSPRDDEFEQSLRLYVRLAELILPEWNIHKPEYIEKWQAGLTKSQQRQGLKAGLADMAEFGFDLSAQDRLRIDGVLEEEGFIKLSELQIKHGRRIKRLLKKKKLTNEDDAIALKGMLDADLLSDDEAKMAWSLIDSFGN